MGFFLSKPFFRLCLTRSLTESFTTTSVTFTLECPAKCTFAISHSPLYLPVSIDFSFFLISSLCFIHYFHFRTVFILVYRFSRARLSRLPAITVTRCCCFLLLQMIRKEHLPLCLPCSLPFYFSSLV